MTQNLIESALDIGGRPPSPGDFIQEDILDEFELTQQQLADRIGVSRRSINELITERRGLSIEMALKLAELTGQSAEYWLNLQSLYDLWKVRQKPHHFGILPLS